MSKRLTLSDFEIEQLVKALENLQKQTTLDNYEVTMCGKRFYQQLIDKLSKGEK